MPSQSTVVLFVLCMVGINNVYCGIVSETNATGEYYTVTDDGTNATDLNKQIVCNNLAGCYIDCTQADSCNGASIDAASTNYLSLICSNQSSCKSSLITAGPAIEANIFCTSSLGQSCQDSTFNLSDTDIINLECDNSAHSSYGGCIAVVLWAENANTVTVNCQSESDCKSAVFHLESVSNIATLNAFTEWGLQGVLVYADNANELEMNCDGSYSCSSSTIYGDNANAIEINCNEARSCYQMTVEPPYQTPYGFRLNCLLFFLSCDDVEVIVPDSTTFVNNYMELICPRINTVSGVCDIFFTCVDTSTVQSTDTTQWWDRLSRRECNNDICCPWTNPNDMIQVTTNTTFLPYSITPTSSNATGEYYVFTDSLDDYKQINCGSTAGCYIECNGARACEAASIYSGSTNYLSLKCTEDRACSGLYITKGPHIQADIFCTASSCDAATFLLSNTDIVNLECDNAQTDQSDGGCYSVVLWAENSNTVTVNCQSQNDCRTAIFHFESVSNVATLNAFTENGLHWVEVYADNANALEMNCDAYYSCYGSTIYGDNANAIEINCNEEYSCYQMTVEPPYQTAYGFQLNCLSLYFSCYDVEVIVPDSNTSVNNYMELVCPRTNAISGVCYILFTCVDTSTVAATDTTLWSSALSRYECNNDICCPWADPNDMVQNTTSTTFLATSSTSSNAITSTSSNATGEYYLFTLDSTHPTQTSTPTVPLSDHGNLVTYSYIYIIIHFVLVLFI